MRFCGLEKGGGGCGDFGGKLRIVVHHKEGEGVNGIQDTGTSTCESREA